MQAGSYHKIEIGGRRVDYVLVASRTARKLRLRVGLNGVEVVRPPNRTETEVSAFLG
jgi:predicted metal-dependent hydrolase